MSFVVDFHVHSRYSRATSKHSDLEHLAAAARKKGITVVGTGDFTHPAWRAEIEEKLEPAEPGLFALRDDLREELPEGPPVRFMLQVEISTIYKKDGQTRKLHHLVLVPDLDRADNLIDALARIGNLEADGRPILGLDSRDLLEITLEAGEHCHLIPAHIWTPWFSLFGSKSGFDSIEHCYADLTEHVFALETGLSSDPPMNWRWSGLDEYTLVSNSDAHSPPKLGREACLFDTELNYFAMMEALKTREGYRGTVEFFPEEGKYHLDGHRKCDVRLDPETTRRLDGECPVCGKDLTVGVLHRVHELADREEGSPPSDASPFHSLIPLKEILAEIEDVGPKTKTVGRLYERLLNSVGPELFVLREAPLERIDGFGRPLITEAVRRMRAGEVIKQPGFDGEYGTIRLFEDDELKQGVDAALLFDLPEEDGEEKNAEREMLGSDEVATSSSDQTREDGGVENGVSFGSETILESLDEDQRRATRIIEGPLLVVAGPGTGKTRTLTHRIAHLVTNHGVDPQTCLSITFTRRAAGEMRRRLDRLTPASDEAFPVMTFHGFGYRFLREFQDRLELPDPFRVASDPEREQLLKSDLGLSVREARAFLERIRRPCEGTSGRDVMNEETLSGYRRAMQRRGWIGYEELIERPIEVLERDPDLRSRFRDRYRWISVDEYQDVDPRQYRLVRHLGPEGANLCVIGDPDQAIYGFRGGDVRFFQQFTEDYPSARTVHLSSNYRSTPTIVDAAQDMIEARSLVDDRSLEAQKSDGALIHVRDCPTVRAEAEFVVHSIERMMGGTTFFSFDSRRVEDDAAQSLSFADVGILYRTDAQSEPLVEALGRSGIPHRKRTHRSVSDHPFVQNLFEHMETTSEDQPVVDRLEEAARELDGDDEDEIDHDRILEALRPVAERAGRDPMDFRSRLTLESEVDLWDPRADCVSLLTLHAAKGLEFPVVFIVGCEDGLIPLQWDDETENLNEERRLFFVGMTRAEDQLFLTHARRRQRHGRIREQEPSRFLDDIDSSRMDRRSHHPSSSEDSTDPGQLELL